jgi:Na+/proline symporter
MARTKSTEREKESFWMGLLKYLTEVFGMGRKFVESTLDLLEKRFEKFQQRILKLLVAYLGTLAGLFFMILGVFYLLIDFAGVPRGVVFTTGGLIVLLFSVLVILANKK